MSIRIVGYDIVDLSTERTRNVLRFNGVAHLEVDRQPVDMPFIGTKLEEQLGFNEFFFKDPDEVRNTVVHERAGDIRDKLSEHLLAAEFKTGEYEADIEV
jgi:hypothetical protein